MTFFLFSAGFLFLLYFLGDYICFKSNFINFKSKTSLVLLGQCGKRPEKGDDVIFSHFWPNPKTHEKASQGQYKQKLSIFSAFKWTEIVLLSIEWSIFPLWRPHKWFFTNFLNFCLFFTLLSLNFVENHTIKLLEAFTELILEYFYWNITFIWQKFSPWVLLQNHTVFCWKNLHKFF